MRPTFDWDRGSMDIAAAAKAGITFFTHKASEGTSMQDPKFGAAMTRAKASGIRFIGAYHVVRSSSSATAQADYMIAYLNKVAPWWKDFDGFFFQADVEKWPSDAVAGSLGEQFADILETKTGRKCIIYASKTQYPDTLTSTSHELWNANYPTWNSTTKKCPLEPYLTSYSHSGGDKGAGWVTYSGKFPKIWQYSDNAIIGSQSNCDANAFQGTVADFAVMIGASVGGSTMEQSDKLLDNTGFPLRTIANFFGDLQNLRNYLIVTEGSTDDKSLVGAPSASARIDVIYQAAKTIVGWGKNGIPVTLSDSQMTNIVNQLAGKFLTYDEAVKAGQEALMKGAGA